MISSSQEATTGSYVKMKAIALISGGLDSILAARLIKEEGLEVLPLNFRIPFYQRSKKGASAGPDKTSWVAENLGADLKIIDIADDFLQLLLNPRHGFGSNINPCIDCKILMLRKTKELMKELDAAFVVTGEVLGQRPMSQHKQALEIIDRESALEGLILRPLCAKLLPETIPEREGWVAQDKLLCFSGRTRRPQMELARKFNIKEYPNPAGGCLLTDPEFTKRLKDLMAHKELNLENVKLLKIGRHFRISEQAKLIVGRNEKENDQLFSLAKENDNIFSPPDEMAGPISLGRGIFNEELVKLSCSITSRYCDLNGRSYTDIIYRRLPQGEERMRKVLPLEEDKIIRLRI